MMNLEDFWSSTDSSFLSKFKLPSRIEKISNDATTESLIEILDRKVPMEDSQITIRIYNSIRSNKSYDFKQSHKERIVKGAVDARSPTMVLYFINYFDDKTLADPYKNIIMTGVSECGTWCLSGGYTDRAYILKLAECLNWIKSGEVVNDNSVKIPQWITDAYPPKQRERSIVVCGWT